ncbi:sensor histidine kinase [Rhodococcus sp. 27YEA15]|uniref:sensor histidine kinase n=1 Tax=Rhodococcus sp. 27YEA15 TaxID=3156259 RepID=UPI003C7D13D0
MSTSSPHIVKWGDLLIALGLFAAGVTLYLAGLGRMWTDVTGVADVPLTARVALLAVVCAITSLRRKHSATAFAAGSVLLAVDTALGPTLPMWLVFSDIVYAAIRYGSGRLSRMVFAATSGALTVLTGAVYVTTADVGTAAAVALVSALFFGTPMWWALTIRRQREITEAEREKSRIREALAALDRDAAIAHERTTMARDLHDVIASHLSAIAIHSEAALTSPAGRADEKLRLILTSIRSSSVAGLSEMRSMIELLHAADPGSDPDSRAAPPRLAHLPVLIDAARAAGSEVDARIDVGEIPSIVDHTVYRIIQEALANALTHAPSAPITLTIELGGDTVRVEMSNPAVTHNPDSSTLRHGLANMRHRAELLGGFLDARADGGTWVVRASLPVRAPGGRTS